MKIRIRKTQAGSWVSEIQVRVWFRKKWVPFIACGVPEKHWHFSKKETCINEVLLQVKKEIEIIES